MVAECSVIGIEDYGAAYLVFSDNEVNLAVLRLVNPVPHQVAEIRGSAG